MIILNIAVKLEKSQKKHIYADKQEIVIDTLKSP